MPDLAEVAITSGGTEVGHHDRCWVTHQSLAYDGHPDAARDLRRTRGLVAVPALQIDVEHRDLADYDRLFDFDVSVGGGEDIAG